MVHFRKPLLKGSCICCLPLRLPCLWPELERRGDRTLFAGGAKGLAEARYPDAERAFEKLRSLGARRSRNLRQPGADLLSGEEIRTSCSVFTTCAETQSCPPQAGYPAGHVAVRTRSVQEALPGLEKGFHRSTGYCHQADVRPAAGEGLYLAARGQQGGGGRAWIWTGCIRMIPRFSITMERSLGILPS